MSRKTSCAWILFAVGLLAEQALAQRPTVSGDRPNQNHPDTPQPFPNHAQARWSFCAIAENSG